MPRLPGLEKGQVQANRALRTIHGAPRPGTAVELSSDARVEPPMRTIVSSEVSPGQRRTIDASAQMTGGDAWDRTDRLFVFSRRSRGWTAGGAFASDDSRVRWLMENDVHTEFVDAGIGCCWFAYRDDMESSGETEEAAIHRLAEDTGLRLWRDEPHGGFPSERAV